MHESNYTLKLSLTTDPKPYQLYVRGHFYTYAQKWETH